VGHLVVGVADCKLANSQGQVLITYALGSCIAVALHDPVSRIGGLLHYMLPDSGLDRNKADRNPYMFADTGVAALVRRFKEMGGSAQRLTVRAAGGANVLDGGGHFNIGKRNFLALRKVLWKAGLMIHSQNVGGSNSRTVSLEVSTGRLLWKESNGTEGELLVGGRGRGGG